MRKKILSFILALICIICLFSCTSKPRVTTTEYVPLEVVSVSDELKSLYNEKSIGFKSIVNARDLGGYVGADGKKVKDKLLIRCGHLANVNDEEVKILKDEYNLKEIIDFRTNDEIGKHIDKDIEGTHYQKVDIIAESGKDDPIIKNMNTITGDFGVDIMISYYQNRGTIDDMYDEIVNGEVACSGYKKFFDILLSNDGATIFHCSSGKDRTGFAAAYILYILGVDKKTILDDYEASNVYYEDKIKSIIKPLTDAGFTENDIIEVSRLVGVDRTAMENAFNMIDENYGGMDNYIHEQIGLTDQEIDGLRKKYLE